MIPKEINHDVYACHKTPNGEWEITKNGDYYMTCSGGEADAKHIVFLLNADVMVNTIKENVGGK